MTVKKALFNTIVQSHTNSQTMGEPIMMAFDNWDTIITMEILVWSRANVTICTVEYPHSHDSKAMYVTALYSHSLHPFYVTSD